MPRQETMTAKSACKNGSGNGKKNKAEYVGLVRVVVSTPAGFVPRRTATTIVVATMTGTTTMTKTTAAPPHMAMHQVRPHLPFPRPMSYNEGLLRKNVDANPMPTISGGFNRAKKKSKRRCVEVGAGTDYGWRWKTIIRRRWPKKYTLLE